jgi:dCMP deaminase
MDRLLDRFMARFMAHAERAAQESNCSRLAVGAVLRPYQSEVTYAASNQAETPCEHAENAPCTRAVHAEARVVAAAARAGNSTEGAQVFVTHAPCEVCAMLLVGAGVRAVYWRHPYRDMGGIELLARNSVSVVQL